MCLPLLQTMPLSDLIGNECGSPIHLIQWLAELPVPTNQDVDVKNLAFHSVNAGNGRRL